MKINSNFEKNYQISKISYKEDDQFSFAQMAPFIHLFHIQRSIDLLVWMKYL